MYPFCRELIGGRVSRARQPDMDVWLQAPRDEAAALHWPLADWLMAVVASGEKKDAKMAVSRSPHLTLDQATLVQ